MCTRLEEEQQAHFESHCQCHSCTVATARFYASCKVTATSHDSVMMTGRDRRQRRVYVACKPQAEWCIMPRWLLTNLKSTGSPAALSTHVGVSLEIRRKQGKGVRSGCYNNVTVSLTH
jgi:hypothetical protein